MGVEQVKAEYKLWKEQNTRDMKHIKNMHIGMDIIVYGMVTLITIVGIIIPLLKMFFFK